RGIPGFSSQIWGGGVASGGNTQQDLSRDSFGGSLPGIFKFRSGETRALPAGSAGRSRTGKRTRTRDTYADAQRDRRNDRGFARNGDSALCAVQAGGTDRDSRFSDHFE